MGTVYFGGNFEGFPVIWDTGSEWPVIMSMRCLSCPPPMAKYNFFDEIGITFYQKPNSCGVRNYGSARIEGCEARDWVCVAPLDDACARNMQIFVGTRQQGLPQEISGIIGLATDADRFIGPNVIKILRNSGAIEDIIFAFYLRSHLDTGSSFIDIGQILNDRMSSPSDLIEISILNEDYFWSNTVKGIKFGSDDTDEWGMEEVKAFLDSGTSFITISFLYWDWFLDHLASFLPSGFTIYEEDADRRGRLYVLTDCAEYQNLPKISLLLAGYWFEILPSDYIINYVGIGCLLNFVRDDEHQIILGIPFMKGYYITHNLDTLKFGIVPQNDSAKLKGVSGTQPQRFAARINDENLMWLWICLGVICGALAGWGIYEWVIHCKKKKKEPKIVDDGPLFDVNGMLAKR